MQCSDSSVTPYMKPTRVFFDLESQCECWEKLATEYNQRRSSNCFVKMEYTCVYLSS